MNRPSHSLMMLQQANLCLRNRTNLCLHNRTNLPPKTTHLQIIRAYDALYVCAIRQRFTNLKQELLLTVTPRTLYESSNPHWGKGRCRTVCYVCNVSCVLLQFMYIYFFCLDTTFLKVKYIIKKDTIV